MLKKRSRILAKVKARFRKPYKYKFGFQFRIDVSESNNIDNNDGNILWQDTIKKDM